MSAPLAPPDSGDLSSTLARDWAIRVNTGDTGTPEWTFVRGLSQINPTIEGTMQDDSDLDSGGYGSQFVTGQRFSIELTGVRKGVGTGAALVADPGQEFLRTKGATVGSENIVEVQWYRTDALPQAYQGNVVVSYKDVGGNQEALQGFTVTLAGRGKPVPIAKPTA